MRLVSRSALAVTAALAVALPAGASSTLAAPDAPAAPVVARSVTLGTGQSVDVVRRPDGKVSVTMAQPDGASGPTAYHQYAVDGHVYVVPSGAPSGAALDWAQYDVTALAGMVPAASAPPVSEPYDGPDAVTLTINGIARDGRPAQGISSVDVINVDNRALYENIGVPFVAGAATLSVPPGNYAVMGYLFTYDEPQVYASEGVATFEPEVSVAGNTTVTLDGTAAAPIDIDAPKPTEATTVTLCYWRQDGMGSSYSHSFTMSFPIVSFFANATDPISVGDFEFYSQHSLLAPDIATSVVDPVDRPIDADYVFSSAKLDGSFDAELVDVGLGRVEDYEGKDVDGKIALIRRGEITFVEKMQNATAAGAVLAMIYNNVPGLLMISGDPTLVPTMSMTQAEGEELYALTQDGTVEVHVDAVRVSSYAYDLVLPEPDTIPAALDYVVDDSTSATVKAKYYGHAKEHAFGELRHKWRPWEPSSFGFLRQMPVPLKRTEMITAGDTWYAQYAWAHSTLALPFDGPMYSQVRTYAAGERGSQSWLQQVLAPSAGPAATAPADSAVYRSGDSVVLNIPEWFDGRGHWGWTASPYDTATFTLKQDSDTVGSGAGAHGTFAVAPGSSKLKIDVGVSRAADWWKYSTETSTSWTLPSDTAASPTVLPLINLSIAPKIKLRQQAKSDTLSWTATHQAGSAGAKLKKSKLKVSFDGGESWTKVKVTSTGAGAYQATLPQPPDGAKAVSLSVRTKDKQGSKVKQTIINAYAVK